MKTPRKHIVDANARLDYGWNWSAWLAVGETITSHSVTADTGITFDTVGATTNVVTCWATATKSGLLTCHITTSQGRSDDRSWFLLVQNR